MLVKNKVLVFSKRDRTPIAPSIRFIYESLITAHDEIVIIKLIFAIQVVLKNTHHILCEWTFNAFFKLYGYGQLSEWMYMNYAVKY